MVFGERNILSRSGRRPTVPLTLLMQDGRFPPHLHCQTAVTIIRQLSPGVLAHRCNCLSQPGIIKIGVKDNLVRVRGHDDKGVNAQTLGAVKTR